MVPAGWDSWGKINVMRDRFDPGRVERAWEASLGRLEDGEEMEKVEDLWVGMIPDTERPRVSPDLMIRASHASLRSPHVRGGNTARADDTIAGTLLGS